MKVVTLETAERLKELGYPQGSTFFIYTDFMGRTEMVPRSAMYHDHGASVALAQFAVADAPAAGELMDWTVSLGLELTVMWHPDYQMWFTADDGSIDSYGISPYGEHGDHNPAEAIGLLAIGFLEHSGGSQ